MEKGCGFDFSIDFLFCVLSLLLLGASENKSYSYSSFETDLFGVLASIICLSDLINFYFSFDKIS
jgi:hypothetical protein